MAERARARGVVVAAIALVAAVVLGGCVTLPREGPVEEGPAQAAVDPAPRIIAEGPRDEASPVALVDGWLRAAAALDDDYSVARSFLTAPAASAWRPSTRVVVVAAEGVVVEEEGAPGRGAGDGATEPPAGDVRVVTVQAPLLGEVDEDGRWTPAEPRTPYATELTLVRVSGAWRISSLPDEVVLGRGNFDTLYRPFQLQLLSSDRRALVPETRWFPQRQATATLLVSELLEGPSPWLADATSTAFPEGTRLLSDPAAVPVEGTTAVVDLTGEARTASPEDRLLMQAQVTATLRGVPGVTDARLAAEGSALTLPPGTADVLDDPVVTGTPVVVDGGRVARLDGSGLELLDVPDLGGRGPRLPAVQGDVLAVLVDDRTGMLVLRLPQEAARTPDDEVPAGGDLDPVVSGTDLVGPSVDRLGWAWSARPGGGLVAADADGDVATTVDAPGLDDRRVYALQVSRDGGRVAVLSTDAAGTPGTARLDVGGVGRTPGGVPARVDVPPTPLPGLVDALDVTWVDAQTVAVLGRVRGQDGGVPDTDVELLEVAVDGSVVRTSAVPDDAVRLTSAKGRSSLLLETGGGLRQRSGIAWPPRPGAAGADASFPG